MRVARPLNVVIVGGGAAATEVALVLREHATAHAHITFVAPEPEGGPRPLSVSEPFTATRRRPCPLSVLARELGADLHAGRVTAVDGDRHEVRLDDGWTLGYDALVLATGARPRSVIDDALTLFGHAGPIALDRILAELDEAGHGWSGSITFVIPPGITRALSLYELAVLVGAQARVRRGSVRLTLLTPEVAPLEGFGPQAQAAVGRLLDDAGVTFVGSAPVFEGLDGRLRLGSAGRLLGEDGRVVTLPVLDGSALPGVPATDEGFVPIDGHGVVPGMDDVFAAGDATACTVKHVDVACAQAATVADVLAACAGAAVTPAPWMPSVREHLLADFGIGTLSPHDAAVLDAYQAIEAAVRSLGIATGIKGARLTAQAPGLAGYGLIDHQAEEVVADLFALRQIMERPLWS